MKIRIHMFLVAACWVAGCSRPALQPAEPNVPPEALPVYSYIRAALTDDFAEFKASQTQHALARWKRGGTVTGAFEQVKSAVPEFFKHASLEDFSFEVEPVTHVAQFELDGEYSLVWVSALDGTRTGYYVEKENRAWKITDPRYANLEAVLKLPGINAMKSERQPLTRLRVNRAALLCGQPEAGQG